MWFQACLWNSTCHRYSMGAKQGKTRVPLGDIKQKKKGGFATAQKSQAVMEVKTVTPDNEMCSDGAHKLGHCIRHHVELLHAGRGAPFNLVAKYAANFLEKKKIQAVVFDGTGAEAGLWLFTPPHLNEAFIFVC